MAQRAEFRKPCEVIAREATREWIEIRSDKQGADVGENDGAAQRIGEIEKEFERLNVRRVIRTHVLHGLLYGLGHVWIGIKDAALTTQAQSQPLVIGENGMRKGSLERLANIEPIWTTPNSYNANNPLARNFYKPDNWWVLGTMVDSSRLLTTIPYPVSQILVPAFNFGGQSLIQLLRAYVHNYLATRNSTATIVRNFSKLVLKTDMTGNMQTDIGAGMDAQPMPYGDVDMASVQGRAAYMQDVSEGQGTIVVDKEREDASIIATPLSGLDSLQAQSMEAMASIPGIPLEH
nr:anti-CBASS Acb1 family protein [Gluconobacter kondonii]